MKKGRITVVLTAGGAVVSGTFNHFDPWSMVIDRALDGTGFPGEFVLRFPRSWSLDRAMAFYRKYHQ